MSWSYRRLYASHPLYCSSYLYLESFGYCTTDNACIFKRVVVGFHRMHCRGLLLYASRFRTANAFMHVSKSRFRIGKHAVRCGDATLLESPVFSLPLVPIFSLFSLPLLVTLFLFLLFIRLRHVSHAVARELENF